MPWNTPELGGLVAERDGNRHKVKITAYLDPDPGADLRILERAKRLSTGGFLDAIRQRLAAAPETARYRTLKIEADEARTTIGRIDIECENLERTKAHSAFWSTNNVGGRLTKLNRRLADLQSQRVEAAAILDTLSEALGKARERAVVTVDAIAHSVLIDIAHQLHDYKASLFASRSGHMPLAPFLEELVAIREAELLAGKTDGLTKDARWLLDEPVASPMPDAA
jgi:hypothetical protein